MTIEFTEEEMTLAKQISEIYRMPIGEGDWYISEDFDFRSGWSSPRLNDNDYEPVK